MMELKTTGQFRKDYKRCKKRGLNMNLLKDVIGTLLAENLWMRSIGIMPLSATIQDLENAISNRIGSVLNACFSFVSQ